MPSDQKCFLVAERWYGDSFGRKASTIGVVTQHNVLKFVEEQKQRILLYVGRGQKDFLSIIAVMFWKPFAEMSPVRQSMGVCCLIRFGNMTRLSLGMLVTLVEMTGIQMSAGLGCLSIPQTSVRTTVSVSPYMPKHPQTQILNEAIK